MLDRLKRITNSKSFHIVVIIVIITIILFTAGLIILKYNVEGETNMPFDLTKISVISTSEGIDKEAGENKWAFDVNQNNDIYLYIDKNKNYSKTEAIKSISIENINVESKINEKIKIYKPAVQVENSTFKNTQENEITNLEYLGDMQSDLKNLKISNQGGLLAFRCAINNVAEYKSNDEEINHYELLKKAAVNHSGRSAATGAVAGAILGLRLGRRALPDFYIECLEPGETLAELAYDVYHGCPMERGSKLFDLDWDRKYIHGGK